MSIHDNKSLADAPAPAKVAHELANLLDGSLRNVSLVMSRLRDAHVASDADAAELLTRLNTANEAMRQMAKLLTSLMNSRETDHAASALWMEGQTLGDAVRQAMALLSPLASQSNIALHEDLDAASRDLPAGPMLAVVVNLVRNSLQALAGHTQGRVTVTTQLAEGWLELIVTDNGPGFPLAMFDAQGQLRHGMTLDPQGHGLGLAMVREVALAMDGQMVVSSPIDPENQTSPGARVCVRLAVKRLVETLT